MKTALRYGRGSVSLELPEDRTVRILEPRPIADPVSQEAIVVEALENPIGSPGLRELTRDVRSILVITNDSTRPQPSRITLPILLGALCHSESHYDVTVLVATGLHRAMTKEEMEERFGEAFLRSHRVINHCATDEGSLVSLGELSTGNELLVNRLVAESDLVIAEGFIESHFFAGFSGGRKSILPGVSGAKSIMRNHGPANIASPYARSAHLAQNPIHSECVEAARRAKLAFILNVALNENKKIVGAFAGDFVQAHEAGCRFVHELMAVPAEPSDIVVTGNNGYPLDRDLYQAIKGVDTASQVVKENGIIIIAAQCVDGVGHEAFADLILSCSTKEALWEKMSAEPSMIDKWQVQILARVLLDHPVILVNDTIGPELAQRLFFRYAPDLQTALSMALAMTGEGASITVIPEGPVIMPVLSE